MRVDELTEGLELGPSSWVAVDQARIDAFAEASGDDQWIHVDPRRAENGPFGGTIAHGFLTLSLLAPFTYELLPLEARSLVNYGLERVRFPDPVPAGSRIRATYRIDHLRPLDGGVQITVSAHVEREGGQGPVCVAQFLLRVID